MANLTLAEKALRRGRNNNLRRYRRRFDKSEGQGYRQSLTMRLRRSTQLLSSLLICCQAVTLTVSSFALGLSASSGPAAVACTCIHSDHARCAMEHPASQSKSDCCCRSTADPAAAILIAIVGPNAVMPQRIALEIPRSACALNRESAEHLAAIVLAPDGPPPRARA